MKKLLAFIMALTMIAACIPASFAIEAEKNELGKIDKSQFGSTIEAPKFYGIDKNGNKVAAGSTVRATTVSDTSDINVKSKTETKANTKGFADSIHYGAGLFDQSDSLELGYTLENADFTKANDFYTDKSTSYSVLISPAGVSPEQTNLVSKTGLKSFSKGEKFWFNYDIISGFNNGPIHYTDEDGKDATIPFEIYMYSGTAAQWDSEVGVSSLKLCARWQGLTRISQEIVVPASNTVYVFAIVLDDAIVQDYGIRGFQGWFQISDHERTYKDLTETATIEVGKSYTADLGSSSKDMTLVYGDDVGLVLANAKLYKVELEAGQKLALRAEGDGNIGGRVFFLDENKDIMSNNFLGTGAVTSSDDYKALTWAIFPPVSGTYYIMIAGFCYADEGKMDFELVEYSEAQGSSENLPYFPEVDVNIDLETLVDGTIETIDGIEVWGYFYDSNVSLGILVLAYPGTYHITGDNQNVVIDAYDSVVVDYNSAKSGAVICNPTWGTVTINATGEDNKIVDGHYGIALYNYDGCYGGVYFTGEELSVEGEKGNGILLQCPTHIYTKNFSASATVVSGQFTVAMWTEGWNAPKLTLGENAKITDASGSSLKLTSMYWDANNYYRYGYTISSKNTIQRYEGSSSFYDIADHFTIVSDGQGGSVVNEGLLGDANEDGKVNTGDAVAVLKHSAGSVMLTGQKLINADYNKDGKVNTGDAVGILKFAAGM